MSAAGLDTGSDTAIRTEAVNLVMRQTPVAIATSAVNALLLTAALGPSGRWGGHLAWLGLVLAISALRLWLWRAWRQAPQGARTARRWSDLAAASATAVGLCWGLGAALLWPAAEPQQLLWTFVIGGMSAGAVALNYAHPPSVLGFVLAAALPVAWRQATGPTQYGVAAAAMICLFLVALAASTRRSARLFADYVRLRLDAARRAVELDASHARLQREMAEHRATEESLRQAQKMEAVGQLTGGIAHDFNNLLMVITASLALLKKRLPPGDPRAERLLAQAQAGADRGAALTTRLLAFSRRQALQPEALDLKRLVTGMSNLLLRSIGPDHRLEFRFPEGLPAVEADQNQLELAVLNLVVNARDAMPEGGSIVIAGEERRLEAPEPEAPPPGRYGVLSVADTGIGMDAATLARATEPFFTTKGAGRGTGLGLSMAQGLATQSGGLLRIHSAPGEGTTVEFWLPCAAGPAMAEQPAAAPVPASGPVLEVLLVDDDPLVLSSTAAMLEDLGHRVTALGSGPEALARLRAGPLPDLVMTDHGMPDMTGFALAREIRKAWPTLPVLLATGYAELPARPDLPLPRIVKPFGQAELARAIERCAAARVD